MPDPIDPEVAARWERQTREYVAAINDYVARGEATDWEDAGEEPDDPRTEADAAAVLDEVRRVFASGDAAAVDGLAARLPRAHSPLLPWIETGDRGLPAALILDDGRLLLQLGHEYQDPVCVAVEGLTITPLDPAIRAIGRSPDRRWFARATDEGIAISDGWDGEQTALLPYPTGLEGVVEFAPEALAIECSAEKPFLVKELIPLAGDRCVLISECGVFVLQLDGARRLIPTPEMIADEVEWRRKDDPDEPIGISVSMGHAGVSPDGRLIAAGCQDSLHHLFDAATLEEIGTVGPMTSYPHHAAFDAAGTMAFVNSCHFYNGITLGVPLDLLPGLKTEEYEKDDRLTTIDEQARVYASAARIRPDGRGEWIFGDANGYVRGVDNEGEILWSHFIGSSVGAIEVSADGSRLVVTTYAGFVSLIDLDTGEPGPHVIGRSGHTERRRWVMWKNDTPFAW